MAHFYADIHCHTTTKPFLTQRGADDQKLNAFQFANNRIVSSLLKLLRPLLENITGIKLSTQSNFDALFAGGHRIVMISITPPETGFFVMNQNDEPLLNDTLKAVFAYQRRPYMGTIKHNFVNALTGFSIADIEFCKNDVNDYYADLLKPEYDFLLQHNNKKGAGNYILKLVKNFTEADEALNSDPQTLCVIITIEGAHSFYKAPQYGDLLRSQRDVHSDQDANMTGLDETVDNILKVKQWEYPPFFVTLFHHQWNGLGGHSRSMNRMMSILINQDEGMNIGLRPIGKEVIKHLLSETNGKRILIDIKHMSPRSRRDYYQLLSSGAIPNSNNIPIICSHTGVVKKRTTLLQMIELSDHGDLDELDAHDNYLHECSINLCSEDVLHIFESNGLLGIQLDEKRIAGKEIIKIIQQKENVQIEEINRQYASVVLANILRVVQIINKPEVWNIICIGSDFDGLINHLDCCPSSVEVPKLESFMLDVLNNNTGISQAGFNYSISANEIHNLLFGLTPEEAMEKVFYTNVESFLRTNFK